MNYIILSFILDALLINLGFVLTFCIRYPERFRHPSFSIFAEVAPFLSCIFILSFFTTKIYRRKFISYWALFKQVFYGLTLGTFFCVSFIYVFRVRWGSFPSGIFMLSFILNLFLVFGAKAIIYKLRGKIFKSAKFIGAQELDVFLLSKSLKGLDEIVLTSEMNDIRSIFLLMGMAKDLGIKLSISEDLYEKLLRHKIHNKLPVYFLMPVYLERQDPMEEFFIRSLDVLLSLAILIFLFPVLIPIVIFIKIDSSGPVIYSQKRLGRNGKIFSIYKFRTMKDNAEKETGPILASSRDPRVTCIGRFLRRTRMDEVPQFINVLKGDMSLVGPRPERLHFVEKHRVLSGVRLSVKPGITGLAQIRRSYDLIPEHKSKYDHFYIRRRSFLFNLEILAKTIPIVLGRGGW